MVVALLRVYGAIFDGTVCLEQHAESTTALARVIKGKKIEAKIEHLDSPIQFDTALFTSSGNDLQATIQQLRKAMELTTARTIVEKMNPGDIILLDGSLIAASQYDSLLYESLFLAAKNKEVFVLGLSKTTKLQCTSGIGAIAAVRLLEPPNTSWFYQGVTGDISTHL